MYLIALIFPLAFFYSPKVEKSKIVVVTKPLSITQERNTPAYALFQQAQNFSQRNYGNQLQQMAHDVSSSHQLTEDLNQTLEKYAVQIDVPTSKVEKNVAQLSEVKISQEELNKRTESQLKQMIVNQNDSTTLSQVRAEPKFDQVIDQNTAIIRGQFELADGVGIVDHIVSLRRIFEGQSYELGQVDLNAGQYQIAVGSFEGEIVAEIKDRSGIIIGEDRQKLFNLKRVGSYFEGPNMKLGQPSGFAFNPRAVDERRLNEKNISASLFSENYTLKKTNDFYPNVARQSSTLGLIKDKSNQIASTLTMRMAQDKSETVLFSKKWVEGVKAYLSELQQMQYRSDTGFLVGRIVVDGKAKSGVQVAVENQPSLQVYYLDQFLIPQQNKVETTDNGYFVIPALNAGSYHLTATINDRILGSTEFIVESEFVSYQEIQSSSKAQSVVVRSFDAFTAEPVATDVYIPGLKEVINIDDLTARYRTLSQAGQVEVINRPKSQNYSPYIYLYNQQSGHLHLPQISDAFIDSLKTQARINYDPEKAVFIGFTPQRSFEVHIADENFNLNDIVYFDQQGQISPYQVPGGGFVLFNMPLGSQEVILQEKKTDRTFSTAFYSQSGYLIVTHFTE